MGFFSKLFGRRDETVRHIVGTDPALPSTIRPDIDRGAETILLKCLAKEPERRYQGAGELARDIRRYLAGESIEARRDSFAYIMAKRLKRYRVAATVASSRNSAVSPFSRTFIRAPRRACP